LFQHEVLHRGLLVLSFLCCHLLWSILINYPSENVVKYISDAKIVVLSNICKFLP
jgi:hypothetical protein